jgi:HK97 family phage major capsid protein
MTTANVALRERLKEIREQISAKRAERASKRTEREAAKQAFATAKHDGPVTDWPEFTAAEQAVAAVGSIEDELAALASAEESILKMLGDEQGPADSGGNDRGSAAAVAQAIERRGWSGRQLLAREDSPYRQAVERGVFTSNSQFGAISLGEIANRDEAVQAFSQPGGPSFMADLPAGTAAPVDTTGVAPAIRNDYRGVFPPVLRRLTFLDLIPKGTTDSNTVEYVQVASIPGSAAPVAEGAVKPQQGLTLVDATAPVRTIAGWIKVNRQAMDDMAGLATLINSLLPYDVRRQIEAQILTGNGTGQNLRGIFQTSGINDVPFVASSNPMDMILRAITTLILNDADPNVAVLNPLTWQDVLIAKASTAGTYLAGGPFEFTTPTLWGLAITASRSVPQATPLVGDSTGATLLFREGVNVKTSDSDQDDFVRNRVTILAEARVAFPVWRPANWAVAHTS